MEWRLPQNEDSVPLILEDSHLTDDELELYCLNMLDEERDVPLVEEHLLYCEHCQKRLEKAQSFVDAAKSGAERAAQEPPQSGKNNPLRIWTIVAVAAAASLGVVLFNPSAVDQQPAPMAFELMSLRDQGALAVPAGRPLQFKPDLEGLAVDAGGRYQIARQDGTVLASGALGPRPVTVLSPALATGSYWLRVLDGTGQEVLREFAISVR